MSGNERKKLEAEIARLRRLVEVLKRATGLTDRQIAVIQEIMER